jgi:uncharacterized protein (DUF2236 family)
MPGNPKNAHITMLQTQMMSLNQPSSQRLPIHSSYKGHSAGFLYALAPKEMQLEITKKTRVITKEYMNVMNELWLLTPTQLLIHGQ